jgi:predicted deacylase
MKDKKERVFDCDRRSELRRRLAIKRNSSSQLYLKHAMHGDEYRTREVLGRLIECVREL